MLQNNSSRLLPSGVKEISGALKMIKETLSCVARPLERSILFHHIRNGDVSNSLIQVLRAVYIKGEYPSTRKISGSS